MPRHKSPETTPVHAPVDKSTFAASSKTLNELAVIDNDAELRTMELARKLGYDGPLDPDVIERGVVNQMRRTVEACLETGRMLVVLKERVGHGNFLARLERLGVAERGARKFMQAALKFSNRPSTAVLASAVGSQTKLLELLVLDQEEITELGEEGSVLGIELDEIASLSASELRARLRDAKQAAEAKDKIIAKRDAKIAKLEEKAAEPWVAGLESVAKNAEEAAALDALNESVNAVDVEFTKLGMAVAELSNHSREAVRTRALQAAQYLIGRMRDVVLENGLEISVEGEDFGLRPAFLDYAG